MRRILYFLFFILYFVSQIERAFEYPYASTAVRMSRYFRLTRAQFLTALLRCRSDRSGVSRTAGILGRPAWHGSHGFGEIA